MIKALFGFFVLAGFGLPTWVYFQSGFPIWGIACVLVAVVWTLAFLLVWVSDHAAYLVFGMAFAAAASWLHPQPNALILSALFTLAAWDLGLFQRRLLLASSQDDIGNLTQRHVRGLLAFLLCGVTLSWMAVSSPLRIDFWLGVVVMVICFAGLMQLIRRLFAVGRTPNVRR